MRFVQTIEFTTTRIDEITALDARWRESTAGKRTATEMRITEDRDRPNTGHQGPTHQEGNLLLASFSRFFHRISIPPQLVQPGFRLSNQYPP